MVDKCNLYPLNQYEFKYKDVSPMIAGVTSPREVDTLESKSEIPAAESAADYLASISDLPQDHQVPNPGDELGLAKLMLKQTQIEDNLERGRRLYEVKVKERPEIVDILNKDFQEFKRDMEEKLEHVNSVMDVYLIREREKEIRDRDLLLARQMQEEEEQRAQEEQRKAQREYEKIQEEQRK